MNLQDNILSFLADCDFDDFTIIRFVYLYVCNMFSYDVRFIYGPDELKKEIYDNIVDIKNVQDFEIVCYAYSCLIVDILALFNIHADICQEPADGFRHAYVVVTHKGMKLKLDPTIKHDTTRVKMHSPTLDFQTLVDDSIFSDQLDDSDEQIKEYVVNKYRQSSIDESSFKSSIDSSSNFKYTCGKETIFSCRSNSECFNPEPCSGKDHFSKTDKFNLCESTIKGKNRNLDYFYDDCCKYAFNSVGIKVDYSVLYDSENIEKLIKVINESAASRNLTREEVFIEKFQAIVCLINTRTDFTRYDDIDYYFGYLIKKFKINTPFSSVKPGIFFKKSDTKLHDYINVVLVECDGFPPVFYVLEKKDTNYRMRFVGREELLEILDEYSNWRVDYFFKEKAKKAATKIYI